MIEKSKKVWMRGNPSNPKGIIITLQSYGGSTPSLPTRKINSLRGIFFLYT